MPHKIEYAERCDASWQVEVTGGCLYVIKCRACGTTVASGGTPKCLLNKCNVSGSAIDVVKWIAGCPVNIDEATVPKAGIDAAPEQVVVNLSISYKWWLKLKEVAEHCR